MRKGHTTDFCFHTISVYFTKTLCHATLRVKNVLQCFNFKNCLIKHGRKLFFTMAVILLKKYLLIFLFILRFFIVREHFHLTNVNSLSRYLSISQTFFSLISSGLNHEFQKKKKKIVYKEKSLPSYCSLV